jgi:predicted fused transcriptional regulator/phosphomethylpyrimidine kinase
MIIRMVNAIARTVPTVNTNLAGFGFGAMVPSRRQIDVAMPDLEGRIGRDV